MRRFVILIVVAAVALTAAGLTYAGGLAELRKKLSEEIGKEDYTSAALTLAEIGEENSLEAVKLIVKVALEERIKSQEIFQAAKEALSEITDKQAIGFLCEKARKTRDPKLKFLLAEVLGNLKGDEVLDALTTILKDRNTEVVREAIISLRKLGDIKAVEKLIEALGRLEKEKGRPWVEARGALHELTGGYDYTTAAKWREFWERRKEDLKGKPDSPETAKPAAPGEVKTGLLEEEKKKAPKFFGKEILSRKIVFVIDVSGSMIMKDRGTGGGEAGKGGKVGESDYSKMSNDRMRIERAKNELSKAVAGLPPKAKFNIIAFANYVSPWQKQKLVIASPKNKKAAIAFVKKFRAGGGTFTDDALKEAFANKEADTIYFLSDGAPERYASRIGQENPQNAPLIDKCLNFVRQENKFRKVKMYVFGFDGEGVWDPNLGPKPAYHLKAQRFIDFMKKLAEENGGEYKSIR
jgi:hypothetical protein